VGRETLLSFNTTFGCENMACRPFHFPMNRWRCFTPGVEKASGGVFFQPGPRIFV